MDEDDAGTAAAVRSPVAGKLMEPVKSMDVYKKCARFHPGLSLSFTFRGRVPAGTTLPLLWDHGDP